MTRVVNHARPKLFGFAADNGFSMSRDFIRAVRGMKPAHDDRHAAFAKFGCDLIGAFCRVGLDADSDEVGRLVERNRFHPVIVKTDFNVARRQSGESSGRQRLHLPGADVFLSRLSTNAGMDDRQAHEVRAASTAGRAGWKPFPLFAGRPMTQSQL